VAVSGQSGALPAGVEGFAIGSRSVEVADHLAASDRRLVSRRLLLFVKGLSADAVDELRLLLADDHGGDELRLGWWR
jgi:hypothetical protein